MDKYTKAVLAVVAATLMSGCADRWEQLDRTSSVVFTALPNGFYRGEPPGEDKFWFAFSVVGIGSLGRYSEINCAIPPGEGFPLLKVNKFEASELAYDHLSMAKLLQKTPNEVLGTAPETLVKEFEKLYVCRGKVAPGMR